MDILKLRQSFNNYTACRDYKEKVLVLSQVHRQHIRGVLEAVSESAHYPESSEAEVLEGGDAAADPDALQAAEAEAAAAERRAELFVLFRNASKVAPEEGYAVTGTLLQRLVSQPTSEFRVSSPAVQITPSLQRI